MVPREVGAIVLVGGEVVGIERTPSSAFWRAVWGPLIRVCYGSLAIQVATETTSPPVTRVPLQVETRSIAGLRAALVRAEETERVAIAASVLTISATSLTASEEADEKLGALALTTVASPRLSGQVVTEGRAVRFASLCAAA